MGTEKEGKSAGASWTNISNTNAVIIFYCIVVGVYK